jgi:Arc/MetJ-type ribon-helix-helix transcriptional regulator
MKTISVKLPESLAAWLARMARRLGRSQSDIVREALTERRQANKRVSCHDLLDDVCGTFKGPRDLSTNPRHLDGFGR